MPLATPLYFLMRLQHRQLPLHVETPEEVRLVSVLKATGLIEAQIHPLESTEAYASPQGATVLCITEEGLAELDRWMHEEAPKPRQPTSNALNQRHSCR
jgi:hypothetical protein